METCELCDGPLDEHFAVYTTCKECGRICGPCCDAGDRLCAPCAKELASWLRPRGPVLRALREGARVVMDRDEAKTRAAELDRLRRSIFARCRELGFGEEERREVQLRATGKESLTSMTADEMRAVVRALGGGTPDRSGLPRNAHAAKLRALWISAFWLGVVRDRSDQALGSFVCRQSGLAAARWATPAHTAAVIEALKDWMAREADVDWTPYGTRRSKPHHCPGGRVLEALWRQLHAAGQVRDPAPAALDAWVVGYRGSPDCYTALPAGALNQLIARLGEWLREASA